MSRGWLALLVVTATAFFLGVPGLAEEAGGSGMVILDTHSFWRFRTVWETPEVVLPSGEVLPARFKVPRDTYEYFRKNPDKNEVSSYTVEKLEVIRLPSETSLDWMKPDFDDSTWARLRGPMLDRSINDEWKLILMRGLFEVTNPNKVGKVTLSLAFRGGAVLYLNGEEVARAFMPEGEIDLYTPADPYPEEVYLTADGFIFYRTDRSVDARGRMAKRIRRLINFKIPTAKLRKGVNVLAVAIHRAPTDAKFFLRRSKTSVQCNPPHRDSFWAKIGLIEIRLAAPAGAAVVPNVGPQEDRGFRVWNQSIIQRVLIPDYPDPFAPLRPIHLTGVRNGTFAGQVIVGDSKPIKGLKAEASDLEGPGTIPASVVQIRYALPDGEPPNQDQPPSFDSLEEFPPDEVPVYKEHGGAVQPIWVTVRVPADAKPGGYTGTLTISAKRVKPVVVPLQLRVIDWTLPDPNEFAAYMDIVESPESVALAYEVPLWSEEHLKLLDKTFSLLAPLACKTLYVTCVRRTHLGNEHAMVRWIRDDEGELQPDFTVARKYLDVATKHLGKIPGVILYCWEPMRSMGHAGGAGSASRTHDKPILISLLDLETGNLLERKGPAWGTSEAKVFWKKLTDGISAALAKHGLRDSMLFGLMGDARPTKQAMDDMSSERKELKWAIHSHYYCDRWQGYDIGMCVAVWGIHARTNDPSISRGYGWRNPFCALYFPREMRGTSTLVEHHTKVEHWLGAEYTGREGGPRGIGRLGADFWKVMKDQRGRVRGSLAGRYPESYWGQLNLNYGIPHLLGRGKNGPVATLRSEAFRENIQEVEARVYIEKALLDDEAKTMLGEELADRCRKALDERIRMCLHAHGEGQPWFISSDWSRRTELLFSLAAEVGKKLGGREPAPKLTTEPAEKS